MKAHRRILLVSALYRFAGDFRLVNLIATVLNQRQTAAQRVPIAIDDFGDPVHGGEQQNIRLADNGADNVRLLIEKFHVDDGIERKVQPVGKMPAPLTPITGIVFDNREKSILRVEGPVAVSRTSPCILFFSALRLTSGTVFPL